MIGIRAVNLTDAPRVSETLIASITELCGADHHNDPKLIAAWTSNKTPQNIAAWVQNPRARLFLAEIDGTIAGVGGISADGEVTLNYVHPDFRFRGVSRTMLDHLEEELTSLKISEGFLASTKTAHAFYLKAGWRNEGQFESSFGVDGIPMRKTLVP